MGRFWPAALLLSPLLICLTVEAQRPGGGGRIPGARVPPGPSISQPSTSTGTLTAPVSHHNANEESKVEFRSQTVLVQVPVVVVDKQGKHIHGLSKDDFGVFEDNKGQKVAVFEELTSVAQRLLPAVAPANIFTNRLGTGNQPHSVIVFVLDSVNTPFLDQAYGRRELIRYLAHHIDPGQTFALITLGRRGAHVLHGLTQDPASLLQVLNKLGGEIPAMQEIDTDTQALAATSVLGNAPTGVPGVPMGVSLINSYLDLQDWVMNGEAELAKLQQDQAIESTMRGFLDVAWALSGIPGRKSVIWATGGFPFYIDSPGAVPGGYLSTLYERAMQMMNDAQISVYPIDVRGLVNTSPSADVAARLRPGPAASQQLLARNWLQGSTLDTLRDFADMTGGRAFYNTNDIAGSFQRAAADSASYYLLAYYLDTANRNPGWRKLKVKVNRKDAEVRTRNGFFVTNATVNWDLSRKLDIGFAMYSPFESTGIPMSVQWAGIAAPGIQADTGPDRKADKKKVSFVVRIDATDISLESNERHNLNLDLLAFAFIDKAKEPAAHFSQNFSMPISDEPKFREKGLGYSNALDLAPGKYTVRFVVRDNVSGRVGSVSAPVTIN